MHIDMFNFNEGVGSGKPENGERSKEREDAGRTIDRLFIANVPDRNGLHEHKLSFNLKQLVDNTTLDLGSHTITLDDSKVTITDQEAHDESTIYDSVRVERTKPLMEFLATLMDAETNKRVLGVSIDGSLDASTLSTAIRTYRHRTDAA